MKLCSRSFPGFCLLITLVAAAFAPASAADKVEISLSETPLWDTNPLMLSTGETEIWGSETKVALALGRQTENLQLNADFAAQRNQFNKSSFNSTDLFFNTDLKKKSRLWQWSLQGGVDYDTTRTGEVTTFGRNLGTRRRLTWDVAPGLAYSVSPRTQLALNGRWQERRYEDSAFLTDYRTASLTPSVIYGLTPLQTAIISFQARRYSTLEGGDRTVDSLGPSLGWEYRFRPDLSLELSFGYLASKFDGYGAVDGSWEYNPTYSGKLEYTGRRNQAALTVSRTRQPYANGAESDLTTAKIENKFAITPRWGLNMQASYQKAQQSSVLADDLDNAWEESTALVYKARDRWRFSLSQRYRRENLLNGQGQADRNITRAALTYSWGGTPSF